jgi:hypothetical protein
VAPGAPAVAYPVAGVAQLRDPATIRARCANLLAAAESGRSATFTIDRSRLEAAAIEVEAATRARYPDLVIPYHSRWRHFEAGGVDRRGELDAALAGRSRAEQARARIDLTVVSVLLDAGAGTAWRFDELHTGRRFARSEGLGVASFRAFMAGAFSSDAADPLRVDARGLQRIDDDAIARIFDVSVDNPLVGVAGRAEVLRRLGAALASDAAHFGAAGRPGALYDGLTRPAAAGGVAPPVTAAAILRALLDGLSSIWLTGAQLHGVPLGDVWQHPDAGGTGPSAGWVPFHKLSQWLTYSLLEPFEWAGHVVEGLEALTALPEYRNGGLLLDTGVIVPRDAMFARLRHRPADLPIIEWRALTVALIDVLATRVRARLMPTLAHDPVAAATALPLACLLEGGTWAAGRALAQRLRGGDPPLLLDSDGTVF